MPSVCAEPGCPELATTRGRCDAHQLTGAGDTSWGNRRDRASQNKFRRDVAKLFGWHCAAVVDGVRCDVTNPRALEAHHLQPGNNDPTTGRLLCKPPPLGRGHHRAFDPHAR